MRYTHACSAPWPWEPGLACKTQGRRGGGPGLRVPKALWLGMGTSKPLGRGHCWGRPGPSASHSLQLPRAGREERLLPAAGGGGAGLSVRRGPQVQGVSSGSQQQGATPGPQSLYPETKPRCVTWPGSGTQGTENGDPPPNRTPAPALESRGFLSPTKDSETLKPTHSWGAFVSATTCPGTCSTTQSPVSRNIPVTCHFRSL